MISGDFLDLSNLGKGVILIERSGGCGIALLAFLL